MSEETTTEPVNAQPFSKWSEREIEAIKDPRMQEFATASEFIEEMARRSGVRRSAGAYRQRLMKMRSDGYDINGALYTSLHSAEAVVQKPKEATKQAATKQTATQPAEAKSNGHQKKNSHASGKKSPSRDRVWVPATTLAWLMGCEANRVHQLAAEGVIARVDSLSGNSYLYNTQDAVAYYRNGMPKKTRYISPEDAKEILGFTSDDHASNVFRPFKKDGHILRADVIYLWINSTRAPMSKEDANGVPKKEAARMPFGRAHTKTSKKRPSPKMSVPTPREALAVNGGHQPNGARQPSANGIHADVDWVIDGLKRGLMGKNEAAEMFLRLAQKK